MISSPAPISNANLRRQIGILTERIGGRLAGSPGEEQAAGHLAAEFRKAGAAVSLETFPVMERWVRRQRLEIRLISFGAEEQLSVGSAMYVRRHGALPPCLCPP